MELRGRKVTVMGLGRFGGGTGAARFLVAQGARVTVTDLKPAEELPEGVAALKGLPVDLHLGEHREDDFRNTDLVVASPAVKKSSPWLAIARAAGVPISSEMNLFLERCRAPIVAVTGSAGKSTTSTLLAMALAKRYRVHFGGNIGRSLLEDLPQIGPADRVCLEISSFQLEDAAALKWSPHVAVVTNLSPNHLDYHGTMEAYAAAKKTILRWQSAVDSAVLSADDAEVSSWAPMAQGAVRMFSVTRPVDEGICLDGPDFVIHSGGTEVRHPLADALQLPGRHNVANFLAAAMAAWIEGVTAEEIAEATRDFKGLPHRLCLVGRAAGAAWYDDSKATTPAAAMVALDSFDAPPIVIAGGYDKKIDLEPFAEALAKRTRAVLLVGATAGMLADLLAKHGCPSAEIVETVDRAVERAAELAAPGDVVLLSTGHASWDQYPSYEHRGRHFQECVARLQNVAGKHVQPEQQRERE